MKIDVNEREFTYRILGDDASCGGPAKGERTARRKAWGVFDGDGELVHVQLDPSITPPRHPNYVKVITISWEENDK